MNKLSTIGAVIVALLASPSAFAALSSSTQTQAVDGQDFTFALATSNNQAGSLSQLTITTQADLNGGSAQGEFFTVYVEGINLGNFDSSSTDAYNISNPGGSNFNTYKFSLDFDFTSLFTANALLDGDLDVLVDFASGVTQRYGYFTSTNGQTTGVAPFVQLDFSYSQNTVPEPGSLALLGLGLSGLAAIRRKKLL